MRISELKEKLLTLEPLGLKVYHNLSTEEIGAYLIWSIEPGNNFMAGNRIACREVKIYLDLYDPNEYNSFDEFIFALFDTNKSSIYLETADFIYEKKGTNYNHYVYVVSFVLEGGLDG